MDRTKNRFGLTAFRIARIEKPKSGRVIRYDEEVKRLAVCVYPNGSKVWKYIYPFRGRTRWMTIGDVADLPISLARKKGMQLGGQVADGRDPASERIEERNADTFGALAARYLARAKTVNKSWEESEYRLDKYVLKTWRHRPVNMIRRADVRELLEPLENRPALFNLVRSTVMAVFSFGVEVEVVSANPVRDVKPKETVVRVRTLSDSELIDVWMALDVVPDPIGRILKIMLLTGQRGNEVRHMRWEHIRNGWWQMPGKEVEELNWPGTKNAEDHSVWLPSQVRELIGEGAAGAVFAPVSRQRLANPMAKIWKSMDMPRATPHDMRRTFATTAARLGFPDALIHRVLNHTPGKLSQTYNQHKYEQESRKLMEAVAAKLLGIIAGTDVEADNVVEFRK